MKRLALTLTCAAALAGLLPSCGSGDPRSHALQIDSEDQFIGGAAALGELGDFLLYNDQIRVVIGGQSTSPGFGLWGGALLDVDLVRGPEEYGGEGNDQFGESFPLVNFVTAQPNPDQGQISVVADGSDGGAAIVRVEGDRARYLYLLRLLTDMLNADEDAFLIRTDYILEPGARYLKIVTEVFIPDDVAEENGWTTEDEWHDLTDAAGEVDPFGQLVNGILPHLMAEAEDLELVGGDARVVTSASVDFTAAGVVAGHTIKVDEGGGSLAHVVIEAVSGNELTLEDDISPEPGGAYFRVLGDTGEGGEVFGDFLFMGGLVHFFMPDDENPLRADWNGGMGPGVGFDYQGSMLEVQNLGGSTFSDPFVVDFFAGTGKYGGVSYVYGTESGKVSVPLLANSFSVVFTHDSDYQTLMIPGQAIRFARYLTVGDGDVATAAGILFEDIRDEPVGRVDGFVLDGRSGKGLSGVSVLAFRDPDPDSDTLPTLDDIAGPVLQFETDLPRDPTSDGSFGGVMHPGDYLLMASGPGHVHSDMVRVRVDEGGETQATLVLPEVAHLDYDVVNAAGEHMPCKLTLYGSDGLGKPIPQLGDGYLPGDIAHVEFSGDGRGTVTLEPGTYEVLVSRGPEYSIARHMVTLQPGLSASLVSNIARVVDTSGWISGDFHLHMQNSADSGLRKEDRITTCMAEGVEYAIASDHDYLTELRPLIDEMGASEFINATVANELTTIEQGHFNAWPLQFDPSKRQNGAVNWQKPSESGDEIPEDRPDLDVFTPDDIYESLRATGKYGKDATVVQNNHPRDGLLGNFFMYGLDVTTGEPSGDLNVLELFHPRINPEHFSYDFDAIEASNGKRQDLIKTPTFDDVDDFAAGGSLYDFFTRTEDEQEALRTGATGLNDSYSGALDDWFNFLNQDRRYTITGNSDSHTKTKNECGVVRNYVRSSTDRPHFIDEQELAQNVLEGRVSHSYGPFIEIEAVGDHGSGEVGDTVSDTDGVIDLAIRVQSPTWFDVDRIEVYQNGVMVCGIESDHTCGEPADNYGLFHPNESVINFDGTITLDLADYWFKATPDDLMPSEIVPMDSWIAVAAMGDSSMEPVASALTREPIMVSKVLSGAMAQLRFEDMSGFFASIDIGLGAEFHSVFDITPWGVTNAVWIDADNDGEWLAPGLPGYLGHYEFVEE
jgi:hypothetical protein